MFIAIISVYMAYILGNSIQNLPLFNIDIVSLYNIVYITKREQAWHVDSPRSNLGSWRNRNPPTRPSRLRRRAPHCAGPRSARRPGTSTATCHGTRVPRASTARSQAHRRTAIPSPTPY